MQENDHSSGLKQRLAKAANMMSTLESRRNVTGDHYLGSNIERMIVERELRELEAEIDSTSEPVPPFLRRLLRRS